jgi:hypothetical protein
VNTKVLITISFALVVSIFVNIALGFNVGSKSEDIKKYSALNKELKEQINSLEAGLSEAEGIITDEQLANSNDAKKVVESFFKTQYDYNSETYKERYEKIKPYVNDKVYGQLTTAGIPEIPNVKYENKINDLKLYMTAQDKDLTGLVLLNTVYNIEGVKSPETTQIFQVKVSEENGKQQIVSLEVLGTFASMSES